jgi:cell wall-associated NlpC family hydrolase
MPGNTLTRLLRRAAPLGAIALVLAGALPAHAAPPEPDDPLDRWIAEQNRPAAPPTPSDRAAEMVLAAMNFVDVPYRRGGNGGDEGFDCSGFTRHVFNLSLGLVLPRRVDEQAGAAGLVKVKREELQPGDLVFFNTLKRTFSHVGIYIGEGRFIHSPRTGAQVRVEDMRFAYWARRYTGARRAETLLASAAPVATLPAAGLPAAGNAAEAARLLY